MEPEFRINTDLISEICGLLGDLYLYFKGSVELYLNPESLKIIFGKLEDSPKKEHKEVLDYSRETMSDFSENHMI